VHAAALTEMDARMPYSDAVPYAYAPFPAYYTDTWRQTNKGEYVPCLGPEEELADIVGFSGHVESLRQPAMGSYALLGIDGNICFEREGRLAAYGYRGVKGKRGHVKKRVDWDAVNWDILQDFCYQKNSDRYVQVDQLGPVKNAVRDVESSSMASHSTEADAQERALLGTSQLTMKPKSRTAVLLRASSGREYSENDKQNIRSLVTELSLRSGGEYHVFLLVQVEDDLPLSKESFKANIPKEFWGMVIPWNEATMKEWYPLVQQSQWLSVQKFSQEHPEFDYYWNWEFDSRYTGHYYDLLEKLAAFAKAQPRKGLWERNERFYIPSIHGHYDTEFRKRVEKLSEDSTIWGAPQLSTNLALSSLAPVGPPPPVEEPGDDNYQWGVGEEADYISLTPIFNPVNTSWPGRDDIWGYAGADETPRRASIDDTHSRCSKKLLDTMHAENLRGNQASGKMAPQTVALLHGLKAVYAPIPVFFDRAWSGSRLQKWFNPGPKGVSGSSEESPFSKGREMRFEGSTWHEKAVPPMRLYREWLGWEDKGTGGAEVCCFFPFLWSSVSISLLVYLSVSRCKIRVYVLVLIYLQWEKKHGRSCLPAMLLQPIDLGRESRD